MTQTSLTLLDEKLEAIDAALLDGTATAEQEARGQQLVGLANAAPELFAVLMDFFNIMHDYESSLRKGYVKQAMEQSRKILMEAKGGPI